MSNSTIIDNIVTLLFNRIVKDYQYSIKYSTSINNNTYNDSTINYDIVQLSDKLSRMIQLIDNKRNYLYSLKSHIDKVKYNKFIHNYNNIINTILYIIKNEIHSDYIEYSVIERYLPLFLFKCYLNSK